MQTTTVKCDLSPREQEVLTLIAQGYTSTQIGRRLNISFKTADAHRNNIKNKLGARSIAELVQSAIVFGLIVPSLPAKK